MHSVISALTSLDPSTIPGLQNVGHKAQALDPSVVPAKGKEVSSKGVRQWISDNIIPLGILVVAAVAMFAAKGGKISEVINIGACLLIAICILGMATGHNASNVGTWAVGLIFQ